MKRRRRSRTADLLGITHTELLGPTVLGYAHNLVSAIPLSRFKRSLGFNFDDCELLRALVEDGRKKRNAKGPTKKRVDVDLGDAIRRYLEAAGGQRRAAAKPGGILGRNLDVVANILSLEAVEVGTLTFLLASTHHEPLADLLRSFGEIPLPGAASLIAIAIAADSHDVLSALEPGGRLISSGILTIDEYQTTVPDRFSFLPTFGDLVLKPDLTRERFVERFLPHAPAATLELADFSHVGSPARFARDLLAAAIEQKRAGVNLLLYGETGTGKTEFARLMAAELGVPLHVAGRQDGQGESPTTAERLSSLLLAHRLLAKERSLVMFDEIEDVFEWSFDGLFGPPRGRSRTSKQWLNALLENNPVPTIWASNRTQGIDPAYLRRFSFAIEFRRPSASQRQRVLVKFLGDDHDLTAIDIRRIVEAHESSPAQIQSAVTAARLVSGTARPTRQLIEQALEPMDRLLRGERTAADRPFDPERFSLDAVSANEDLAVLADRLGSRPAHLGAGLSICLYGPPGTGKTEFVRYLAWRMRRRVVYRRVSDIVSCWLGETEKQIARAFREAKDDDALLLFDEADSFLTDRQSAVRSWEVTQVNEFLQQIEAHRGIVACTTNLRDALDPACVRRFALKIEFACARPEQIATLFRTVLGPVLSRPFDEVAEGQVAKAFCGTRNLAAGDLAAVARRAAALGEKLDVDSAIGLVRRELAEKGSCGRSIGFRRAPRE